MEKMILIFHIVFGLIQTAKGQVGDLRLVVVYSVCSGKT